MRIRGEAVGEVGDKCLDFSRQYLFCFGRLQKIPGDRFDHWVEYRFAQNLIQGLFIVRLDHFSLIKCFQCYFACASPGGIHYLFSLCFRCFGFNWFVILRFKAGFAVFGVFESAVGSGQACYRHAER